MVDLILYVFVFYRGGFFTFTVDFWARMEYDGNRSESVTICN